jgi:hypothetical protein
MSNDQITTKDLSFEEYEELQKFEGLLANYAHAQTDGGFSDRVKARTELKQAFLRVLKRQPNKDAD